MTESDEENRDADETGDAARTPPSDQAGEPNQNDEAPKGGVLSDEDIRATLKRHPDFITVDGRTIDFDDPERKSSLQSCGVDLTIGRIYAQGEKQIEERNEKGQRLRLNPGEFAHIESMEIFRMPDNVMGYLVPRSSYSERGLLMLNVGHVDPGWPGGYLTLEVINLKDGPIDLTVGLDRPFSVIFEYMHSHTAKPPGPVDDEKRRNEALARLATSPQTLFSSYSRRIVEDIEKRLAKLATKDEVSAAGISKLTLFVVILSTVMVLACGLTVAWAFWQQIWN